MIETLNTVQNELIVTGDLNIHLNDPADPTGNQLSDTLLDLALANRVNEPTYRHSLHTLDLVIDSDIHQVVNDITVSADISFSDHSLITFSLTCHPYNTKKEKTIEFRKYDEQDDFKRSLHAELATNNALSSSALARDLNEVTSVKRDEHFPLLNKTVKVSGTAPWYNGECKHAKLQSRRAERLSKTNPNDPTLRSRYISALKNSAEVIRTRKQAYYNEFFQDLRNTPRHISSAVSEILGKPTVKVLPDLATTDPLLFCNTFNAYLHEKIKKIREELDAVSTNPRAPSPTHFDNELNEFAQVNPSIFEDIARKCRITHCDLDPVDFSKVSPTFLSDRFIEIINATFSSAEFPTSEKRGLIFPRIKAHDLDPELLNSYRPITNVSYLSKLIETAIYLQLEKHIQRNNILPPTQSAY